MPAASKRKRTPAVDDKPVRPQDAAPLILRDLAAWKAWLEENDATSQGVWLTTAKKGFTEPTSLVYADALDEALCSGWINGQGRKGNIEGTVLSWYTPRRKASLWSQRNVDLVAELEKQGRMRERGRAEVERAQADGRWQRAYAGPAKSTVPDDLQEALDASSEAKAAFEQLKAQERYSILFQLQTATSDALRQKRLVRAVEKLESKSLCAV